MRRLKATGHTAATMAQRHKFDLILSQLRGAGWRVFTEPILRIVDDEWVLRRVDDRLDYLFISESDLKWERKRFTREPFGDYTNVYQPKGSGQGIEDFILAP